MNQVLAVLGGLVLGVFLLVVAPVLLGLLAFCLLCADMVAWFGREKRPGRSRGVATDAVSVVIPTWNGRDQLARCLPSVVTALEGNENHEILVIDNASDDGSAEFLASEFPSVRVVEMGSNLGFGRASNAGFSIARHDVVVLLNNDMRVEPDFLQPLLDGFQDPRVFSVTGQIFFQDSQRVREETGLTAGRWHRGRIHVRHVVDDQVDELFPTFYSGGGSTAFDRLKILELGGFDEILAPFYMEDVDLSYMAWKRGWVNLYAPRSVLYHEHRGTVGRYFDRQYIERVLQKNRILFAWKNIHHAGLLLGHFSWLYLDLWAALFLGRPAGRPDTRALLSAARQALRACGHRVAARRLARVPDAEALRRPLGGFFRDRYHRLETKPETDLQVLFVSPYPIEPPLHGGAVFMKQAVESLGGCCQLHLLCLVERREELARQQQFAQRCASAELVLFDPGRHGGAPFIWPQAAQAYWDPELHWKIHRTILLKRIDVVQLEYSQLASYGETFRQVVCCIFEHDLHFQAVQRSVLTGGWMGSLRRTYEYLRALRFEVRALARFDAVQVCSPEQRVVLRGLLGENPPVMDNLRTAIDVDSYPFQVADREPDTILFVGNFRHRPNVEGLDFLLEQVLPVIRRQRPSARLIVAGAEAPPTLRASLERHGAEYLGPVDEIRTVLGRFAVFAAPILTGSGVRVKLLEAFACGIPVVSTSRGAEGLCDKDTGIAEIEDRPRDFAAAVVHLLEAPVRARAQARDARRAVERSWNAKTKGPLLLEHYAAALETKQLSRSVYPLPMRLDG